jgi:diguanylate cyclase (GGDEF)-like protein/PAS domain S-box-containing protein
MSTMAPVTSNTPPRAFGPTVARWGSQLLVLVVALGAAGSTLYLKHLGERAIDGERTLQQISTELYLQDGLEWRAISGRVEPGEMAGLVDASVGRIGTLLSTAVHRGLSAPRADSIRVHVTRYHAAVGRELALLEAGEASEAVEFDETQVDPAFAEAVEELTRHSHWLGRRAATAKNLSDAGLVLTVVLSLGVTAWIQRRRKMAVVHRHAERKSEARYRALVDRSSDLVLVTDREGRLSYLSPAAERRLGPLTDLRDVLHPVDRQPVLDALAASTPGEGPAEARLDGRLGSEETGWRHYELSVQDLFADPAVGGLVLTGRDVSERHLMQAEMTHRALHDTLTGLPNRALLADRFDHALLTARHDGTTTGLLLLDLDRFKEINDTLGHHVGDELLVQVGARLSESLRGSDTVARLGGDEFAVLLPDIGGIEAVAAVAAKLRSALEAPFVVGELTLQVEASFGVVVSGLHGDDASVLLQRADVAMYVAKERGLGVFAYDEAMDGHTPERLALLGDLRRALEMDELVLHYQPQIDLATNEVRSAEALVRWHHPTRGLVLPDAFIPLAEHTGLIGPLTRHVLDLALAQARRWLDDGNPLPVCVNLSARNLLDGRLPEQVAELLAQHDVPARMLLVEVTESAIMSDPVHAGEVLHRLHALGVKIAIDDFGVGYTSLGQLTTLPISELKIDRSFVMAMTDDRSNELIVNSVVDLGHNLGMITVAEGIETADAVSALTAHGCDAGQGYHYTRPLPADAFDEWRATWTLDVRSTPGPVRNTAPV